MSFFSHTKNSASVCNNHSVNLDVECYDHGDDNGDDDNNDDDVDVDDDDD